MPFDRNCHRRFLCLEPPLLLLLAIVLAWQPVPSASAAGVGVRYSRRTGLPNFLAQGGPLSGPRTTLTAEGAAREFLRRERVFFGVADPERDLMVRAVHADHRRGRHVRLRQRHAGVEVFGGELVVHLDSSNRVLAVNGDYFPIPAKLDMRPAISPDDAVALATEALGEAYPRLGALEVEENRLVVVDTAWYGDPPSGVRLAYYVVLASEDLREAFLVDAQQDAVLDRWNLRLEGRDRKVYDGLGGTGLPGLLVRTEGGPPVSTPADADLAYDWAGDFYDYLLFGFGRDSLDGLGTSLLQTVNSAAPDCPNAFWNGLRVVFCPGTVTDDVVGHELGHGVTQYTSSLIYQNQPGQLNESFSDILGELVDLTNGGAQTAGTTTGQPGPPWTAHPSGPGTDSPNDAASSCDLVPPYEGGVRWLVGEDASAFGGAIRNMWDPTCFGDPDRANSPLQTCSSLDNGGVHSGSGIPNHAFAMLVDGQSFGGETVAGIGLLKAAAIWLRAFIFYLTPASDFADAYLAINQACADLIGTAVLDPTTGAPSPQVVSASDCQEVDRALRATEMDGDGACGAVANVLAQDEPPICGGAASIFFDDMESGSGGWTVSNTSPPTPYDWVLVPVPGLVSNHMSGTAWFAEDRDIGDCGMQDESAVHSLFSPPITVPSGAEQIQLRFDHYIAVEAGYDGGNLKVSVNGGPWTTVPASAFVFNPYNYNGLFTTFNTNPLAGQPGFSAAGGPDGQSQVDLSGFVSAGDTVRLRWDFGKDGCTGIQGWYVDNVEVYSCPCGNGSVEGNEECDGADDASCPGKCRADCTCPIVCLGNRPAAVLASREIKDRVRCNETILKGMPKCKNSNAQTCADPQLGQATALAYGENDHSGAKTGSGTADPSATSVLRNCQKIIGREVAKAFGQAIKLCSVGTSPESALDNFGRRIERNCAVTPVLDPGTGTVIPDVGAPCGPLAAGVPIVPTQLRDCLKATLAQWIDEVCLL